DDLSVALAGGTRRHGDELSEEGTLRASNFSLTGAGGALLRLAAGLRAGAVAAIARIEDLDQYLLLDAGGDLRQRERHGDLDVSASARAACAAAEQIFEPAEVAEVSHED